ncbi:MAG TPA: FtsX-like permease family protein [bacterium]|nr:FtsX-like permease family protein [bacterium]
MPVPDAQAGGIGLRLAARMTLRHWTREPWRAAVTLAGVALGIALVVAIRLSSQAAQSSFERSLGLMAGRADLSLTQQGGPFSESVFAQLAPTRALGIMMPLVRGKLAPTAAPRDQLEVLGADLLKDNLVRDYRLLGPGGGDLGWRDLLQDLPRPDAIFLTQKFADENGIKAGQAAGFLVGDRRVQLYVAGLLADEGAGRALDGSLAVMDLATAQKLFGKLGELDEIQWVSRSEADRKSLAAELARELPPSFVIQRPSQRNGQVEKMLRAFKTNLLALALVSLLVGAFLVYNSMSIAVLRRLGEIGTLRALGAGRGDILRLTLFEAAALGLVGAGAGVFLGRVLARQALTLVGGTLSDLYLYAPLGDGLSLGGDTLAWALMGFLLILLAGLPPALWASQVPPAFSTRAGAPESLFARSRGALALLGILAWLGAAGLAMLPPVGGLPLFGYAAAFALLAGAALLTPGLLRIFCGAARRLPLPPEGWLALRNLVSGLGRSSVAVAALVLGVGLMVSVAVMVGSFRSTVILWLGQTLKADLYLRPAADEAGKLESPMGRDTVAAVAAAPGVAAVERLRGIQYDWRGEDLYVASFDIAVAQKYGSLAFKTRGDPTVFFEKLQTTPSVLVSEPLQLKDGFQPGDRFPLQTPSGPLSLPIAAVYYDYSNDRGTVLMDRGLFTKLFKDDGVNGLAVYLKPGVSPEQGREAVLKNLPPGTQVFLRSNQDLKREVLRVFDRTFAITYAMEGIAVLVAVLGILTTLTALILERGPEIAVLRYLGATRGQVQRTLFWEAGWMGLVGGALGLGVGLLLALLLINVINAQSFGWTIQWRAPWGFLFEALAWVLAATLLAGLYPAQVASRLPGMKQVNPE